MDSGSKVPTPQALVDSVLQLISLPEIYLRLQQTIDDPMHTREQVAAIITYDPGLSARVLRIANSSYYSFPSEIETVAAAVGIIGEIDIRNLVLATTVVGAMNALTYEGVDIDSFWLHSLRCGISARLVAKAVGDCDAEILFLAGILHDLGILVIYQQHSILAGAVARQIDEHHQLRDQAEREVLGFDHAEVGALLTQSWGLSEAICELLRCHHQYQLAHEHQRPAMILALANLMADQNSATDPHSDIRLGKLIKQLNLDQQTLSEIDQNGAQQCEEIRKVLAISG